MAPGQEPKPIQPWRGAWGGAWTVVYGAVTLLSGLLSAALLHLALRAAGTQAVRLRASGAEFEGSDLPARMAAQFDEAAGAIGTDALVWAWTGAAISLAAMVAGAALLRRSETARRACAALVSASVAHSVALALWSTLVLLPRVATWLGGVAELQGELGGRRQAREILQTVGTLTDVHAVGQAGTQLVHLSLAGLLLTRLLGMHSRAWTGAEKHPVALPGGSR